jgi:hypothetical protein
MIVCSACIPLTFGVVPVLSSVKAYKTVTGHTPVHQAGHTLAMEYILPVKTQVALSSTSFFERLAERVFQEDTICH